MAERGGSRKEIGSAVLRGFRKQVRHQEQRPVAPLHGVAERSHHNIIMVKPEGWLTTLCTTFNVQYYLDFANSDYLDFPCLSKQEFFTRITDRK